ncbi:glutathione S-transferase family protein [Phreatobacter aquaticus]|uniref:Glutathione S-transferase family protein n=1 Tax=Phreatobacter aquaticus TaxID=2570229 RepID=A0A4D7QPP2_9HYPH|nr:glutathione S-transferase family protein [Phreatobacter aquaticus]QCK87923.1 glutathione S-transferase family protein [Phreatobacter aquaticus]
MSKRFTLHGFWLSGPTYKVALMLSMAGEPFAYRQLNLRAGEHKSPEFLKINRFGQVPALEDGKLGLSLCQSASILEHLAFELGKFQGDGPADMIHAREWMFWDFDRLAPPIYRLRAQRLGIRSYNQPIVEMYFADGSAALKVLDDALAGKQWLVGSKPTIADIDVYGVAHYAPAAGFDMAAYPNVAAWMKRFEALPGFGQPKGTVPLEHVA